MSLMAKGSMVKCCNQVRFGPITSRSQTGQSALITVIVLLSAMIVIPLALTNQVLDQSSITLNGVHASAALAAAQAGVGDYQNHVNANPNYPIEYCSTQFVGCTLGADSSNPAFVDIFDAACSTSSSSATGWELVSGSLTGVNAEFQYVVNNTQLTGGSGIVYLFVTGRDGVSGNYQCRSLKVALDIKTSVAASSTFTYTGSIPVPFSPPPGTTSLTVTLQGGSGGTGASYDNLMQPGSPGLGGVVNTVIPLNPITGGLPTTAGFNAATSTPAQFMIAVGGQGGSCNASSTNPTPPAGFSAPQWMGGAGGSNGTSSCLPTNSTSGGTGGSGTGGGGATVLVECTSGTCDASNFDAQTPVAVASGGGGAGGTGSEISSTVVPVAEAGGSGGNGSGGGYFDNGGAYGMYGESGGGSWWGNQQTSQPGLGGWSSIGGGGGSLSGGSASNGPGGGGGAGGGGNNGTGGSSGNTFSAPNNSSITFGSGGAGGGSGASAVTSIARGTSMFTSGRVGNGQATITYSTTAIVPPAMSPAWPNDNGNSVTVPGGMQILGCNQSSTQSIPVPSGMTGQMLVTMAGGQGAPGNGETTGGPGATQAFAYPVVNGTVGGDTFVSAQVGCQGNFDLGGQDGGNSGYGVGGPAGAGNNADNGYAGGGGGGATALCFGNTGSCTSSNVIAVAGGGGGGGGYYPGYAANYVNSNNCFGTGDPSSSSLTLGGNGGAGGAGTPGSPASTGATAGSNGTGSGTSYYGSGGGTTGPGSGGTGGGSSGSNGGTGNNGSSGSNSSGGAGGEDTHSNFCGQQDGGGGGAGYFGGGGGAGASSDGSAKSGGGGGGSSWLNASVVSPVWGTGNTGNGYVMVSFIPAASCSFACNAWSSPSEFDNGGAGSGNSVSCANYSFCVAVDNHNALTYNGSTWSPLNLIDSSQNLTSVSCASASFCVAVDNNGNELTYNGSTWSGLNSIDSGNVLNSVSCVASFCVAVDNNGHALIFNGSTWSVQLVESGHGLTSVSCVSSTFCVAVDNNGHALTYNGSTWSVATIDSSTSINSVSCGSTSFCIAVDNNNDMIYNGSSWSGPTSINPNHSFTSISCTATFCVAVDNNGNSMTYDLGTATWSLLDSIDNGDQINSVTCTVTPSAYCVAVDNNQQELSFGAISYTVPPLFSTTAIPVPYFANRVMLTAVGGNGGAGGSFGGDPQDFNSIELYSGATEEQGGQGGQGSVIAATVPVTQAATPSLFVCAGTMGGPGSQNLNGYGGALGASGINLSAGAAAAMSGGAPNPTSASVAGGGGGGGGATIVSSTSGCSGSPLAIAGGGGGGGGGGGSRGAMGGQGGQGATTFNPKGSGGGLSSSGSGELGFMGIEGFTGSGGFGTSASGGGGGGGGGSVSGAVGVVSGSYYGGGGGGAGASMAGLGATGVVYGAASAGPQDWPWPAGLSNSLMNNAGFGNLGGEDMGGDGALCAFCNVTGVGGIGQGYAVISFYSHKVPVSGVTTLTQTVIEPDAVDSTTW